MSTGGLAIPMASGCLQSRRQSRQCPAAENLAAPVRRGNIVMQKALFWPRLPQTFLLSFAGHHFIMANRYLCKLHR
jgi:hypothetical protein